MVRRIFNILKVKNNFRITFALRTSRRNTRSTDLEYNFYDK